MQVLVQQGDGRAYYKAPGVWVKKTADAYRFANILAAIDYCVRNQLDSVNLVVKLKPPATDVVISLAHSLDSGYPNLPRLYSER